MSTQDMDEKKAPAAHGPQNEHDGVGSNNFDFVQISRSSMKAWGDLCVQKPFAAKLLFTLCERMGKSNNAVVCSYSTLQEITGYSRASVAKAIKYLKEKKWIAAIKVGNATAYCVNEKVAWQRGRNQRKYAMFSATVVASESEQSAAEIEDKTELKVLPFIDVKTGERISVGSDELPPPDQLDIDLN